MVAEIKTEEQGVTNVSYTLAECHCGRYATLPQSPTTTAKLGFLATFEPRSDMRWASVRVLGMAPGKG
jgi:hypothetical protein